MAEAEKDAGFLARWSRRKGEARVGIEEPETAPAAETATPESAAEPLVAGSTGLDENAVVVSDAAPPALVGDAAERVVEPPLTLADVAKLTRDSDFTRFMAGGVEKEVKNAALKKLFSDPHFNLMDGLDVYIDNYNVPTPLPQHLLLKMAQAKFLGLIKEQAEEVLGRLPDLLLDGTNDDLPPPSEVAKAPSAALTAPNEDADLQLQPHDDAGRAGATPGPGQDVGREH